MNRRELITGAGAAAAVALAGCLGSAQEDDPEDPSDPDRSDDSPRSIVVSKTGETETDPDLAILDLGVEVSGDDAEGVRDELATRSDELRDALLDYGIDEDDITTSRFYIRERIDERRMREEGVRPDSPEEAERFVYFEGTHSFKVEVHDVDAAGEVVDLAVDAGANQIGRVEFTLSDEKREELREEALDEAIEDARAEAEFVADRIDASIVEVTMIDTSGGRVSPVRERVDMEMAADAASTTFQPGDVTVRATVDVRYEME